MGGGGPAKRYRFVVDGDAVPLGRSEPLEERRRAEDRARTGKPARRQVSLHGLLRLELLRREARLMHLHRDPASVCQLDTEDSADAEFEVEAAVDLQWHCPQSSLDLRRIAGAEDLVDENRMVALDASGESLDASGESQHAGEYRPAAMPRLEIQPFADGHLDEVALLLAARHERHRAAEPLLGPSPDYRREIEELWGGERASGVTGTRDGRMVGYMLGIAKDESRWGPNVWVDPAGHAVEEAEDVRDLYAAAAARWFDEGRTRHYVVAPAFDDGLLDAWHRLSFGQQHAMGIRDIPEVKWPPGVRLAEERDVDDLVELSPLLVEHQARSPVFGIGIPRESPEEIRADIFEDLPKPEIGDLVAERDGRIVGAFQLVPVELSSMHSSLARPQGAVLLNWAATRPDVRGAGVGVALTAGAFAWARELGYETMVTDWRMTNLLASRFWPRRGFRTTFLRLYRSIP